MAETKRTGKKEALRCARVRQQSRGRIAVRAVGNGRWLWFHLQDIQLALKTGYEPLLKSRMKMLDDFRLFYTPLAFDIASHVVRLRGVETVAIRGDRIGVEVASAECWPEVLPGIIATIRKFHPQERVPIWLRPHFDPLVEMWHAPLLAELFPDEIKIRRVNRWLKYAILRAMASYRPKSRISSNELMVKLGWFSYIFLSSGLARALAELHREGRIWRSYRSSQEDFLDSYAVYALPHN